MARRVFFSFHYQRDIWRVSQVRNSHLTKQDIEYNHPIDHAAWEKVKTKGEKSIKSWIDKQLKGAGVTVILIGSETYKRPYCLYEIEQSLKQKKGLLGIKINRLKGKDGKISKAGPNPLDKFPVKVNTGFLFFDNWVTKKASEVFKTYDWVKDDGYNNFPKWVEEAARIAKR